MSQCEINTSVLKNLFIKYQTIINYIYNNSINFVNLFTFL